MEFTKDSINSFTQNDIKCKTWTILIENNNYTNFQSLITDRNFVIKFHSCNKALTERNKRRNNWDVKKLTAEQCNTYK